MLLWNPEPLNQMPLASRRGEPIPGTRQKYRNSGKLFLGPAPTGTASIALDPTLGSFTLLERASH
jgi:hypothetical protein